MICVTSIAVATIDNTLATLGLFSPTAVVTSLSKQTVTGGLMSFTYIRNFTAGDVWSVIVQSATALTNNLSQTQAGTMTITRIV